MAAKRFAACFLMLVLISLLVAYSFSLPLNWRSLNLIKKVNCKGPYIGLITVFPPEETAFFQIGAFKPNQKHPSVDLSGWHSYFLCYFSVFFLFSLTILKKIFTYFSLVYLKGSVVLQGGDSWWERSMTRK